MRVADNRLDTNAGLVPGQGTGSGAAPPPVYPGVNWLILRKLHEAYVERTIY